MVCQGELPDLGRFGPCWHLRPSPAYMYRNQERSEVDNRQTETVWIKEG